MKIVHDIIAALKDDQKKVRRWVTAAAMFVASAAYQLWDTKGLDGLLALHGKDLARAALFSLGASAVGALVHGGGHKKGAAEAPVLTAVPAPAPQVTPAPAQPQAPAPAAPPTDKGPSA